MSTAHSQLSALRYPLDRVATKGSMRVLRELVRYGELPAPKLVEVTDLAHATVREALIVLTKLRLVEGSGYGRAVQYRFNKAHPFGKLFLDLFTAEAHRMGSILQILREAGEELGDAVKSVWVYGSVARREDDLDSDMDIAIVAEPSDMKMVTEYFTHILERGSEELYFRPEPVFIDIDDLQKLMEIGDPWWLSASKDAIAVYGARPNELLSEYRARTKSRGPR